MNNDTITALLFRALQSEFEAVEIYKEVAQKARNLNNVTLAEQFEEIAGDEMVHIGNLQEMLKIHDIQTYEDFTNKMQQGFEEVLKEEKQELQTEQQEDLKFTDDDVIKLLEAEGISLSSVIKNKDTYQIVKSSIPVPLDTFQKLIKVLPSSYKAHYDKDFILICKEV